MYKTKDIILTNVGELSDITMLKLTLQTGYTSALNMHSTTTAHVLKTQICRTVSVKLLQILLMTAWGVTKRISLNQMQNLSLPEITVSVRTSVSDIL